jgi:RNA polymerase sigma-70 factor (ECF subfamily)
VALDPASQRPSVAPVSGRVAVVHHLPILETDAALVEALRKGHRQAPAVLVDRYGEHLRRVLVRVLGKDPELPDLLHDVLVTAIQSVERLQDARALRPWLTSVAIYTARAAIRKRARRRLFRLTAPEQLDEAEAPSLSEDASEALRAAYAILERLPADERIAFALRFIDGMELVEAAAACGVSLSTFKRRVLRAERKFADRARREPALAEWVKGAERWSR